MVAGAQTLFSIVVLAPPDQVLVITLNDDEALINYAKPIVAELRANMVRVDSDFSATPFKAKISNAEQSGSFPPPHVVGYGSSSVVATWKQGKFPCVSTTAARKARSRRRRSWRIFWRASKMRRA